MKSPEQAAVAGAPPQSAAALCVRTAAAADVAAVMALEQATPEAPHWAEAVYVAMLSPGGEEALQRRIWVAEDAGGVAGFAVGRVLAAGGAVEAELESVAVAAKVRRQGVGRALCAAVIAWSRERGAPAVELEVRASSQGAIALYTALGFVPNGRRAMYYQHPVEDALLMSLSVL